MGGCRYYTTVREEVVEENVVLGLQGVPKTMKLIYNFTIIFSVSVQFFQNNSELQQIHDPIFFGTPCTTSETSSFVGFMIFFPSIFSRSPRRSN